MTKKEKQLRQLVEVLRESKSPLLPEDLFDRAGFSAESIEAFYEELRGEVRSGRIIEERPSERTVELRLGKP